MGSDHTLTLDTVNNLGTLYADQGKLDHAEKMYQRALQGYEKALGIDNAARYIPALNTISNLGSLFERQADLANARIMYSKALVGYDKVVGPDHPESRSLRTIFVFDIVNENKVLIDVREPVNNLEGETSHLDAKGTSSKSHYGDWNKY